MINTPTQKELDALEIAGFSSVGELLARYFHLIKIKKELEVKIARFAKTDADWRKVLDLYNVDAIGIEGCQIRVKHD